MSAEIICVGTELLLGDILNGNARHLARQLADLGIPHYYQTVVGDNPARIQAAIAIAIERGAKILIFTGGLGPTPDDLTIAAIADYFKTPLSERAEIIADIEAKYRQRGRVMNPSNRKQALIPDGADVLPNPVGTAPGIIWRAADDVTILTFPGVPAEMRAMWTETAIPYLQEQGWGDRVLTSEMLKFWGISESVLAERVGDLFDSENPTVAPYANYGEVKLRVAARTEDEASGRALIAPIAAKLRQLGAPHYYGSDDATLASVVGKLLGDRSQTLAVAESCTGGGLGQSLTAVPGSSAYFWGGVIAYDNSVKANLLGVDADDLAREGAVSEVVAMQMAAGAQSRLGTDWGLGITGVAGPGGGTPDKPVGLVYVGLASPDGTAIARELRLGDTRGREWVRRVSGNSALDLLRQALLA
ncbi:MAG: competence/damage-inducible protein A [Geitlerinemataceae cyanobacterium]